MRPAIKAEIKKVLSIRSTYVLLAAALLMLGVFSFYALGYRMIGTFNPRLTQAVLDGVNFTAIFVAIIASLNITHEYRYNTIAHSFTSINRRSKVLLAKLLVVSCLALAFHALASVFAVVMTWWGAAVNGAGLGSQEFYFVDTIWRTTFYMLAWTWLGLLFGLLFRHVLGAVATLLILPSTVEGLLSIVVKENSKYLPLTALEQVHTGTALTPAQGALVFSAYLIAGYLVAWWLFLRRDAS